MPLIDHVHTVYRSLRLLGESEPAAATPAVAALRLLLIDMAGEDRQRELISQWNEEPPLPSAAGESGAALRRLAPEGIAFAFVDAGMPVEWARRHRHLFQYMPPVYAALDGNACAARRQAQREARNWPWARDAGNMLLALAVLQGDVPAILAHAEENLAILAEWRAAAPDQIFEHEFEEHSWLRDHVVEMAQWGGSVRRHLEMMAR
jgi:hypothetical protein